MARVDRARWVLVRLTAMKLMVSAPMVAFSIGLLCGCRSVYYAAWEKLGVEKRDLLKERVVDARDESPRRTNS